MADNSLLDDVKEFLDSCVSDLTGMHVKAAYFQNSAAPAGILSVEDGDTALELLKQWRATHDVKTVDALAKVPVDLIDRAQALSARIDKDGEPKPKAKPAAKK